MDNKKIKSIIESLLFIWGEPLGLKDISDILEMEEIEVEKILNDMIEDFDHNDRGLKIVRIKNNYQLCTRPEHDKWISKLSNQNKTKSLSNAALETLSIIAYKQPITRSEMEAIRGVRCDKAVQTLLDRGLVEERGRLEKLGRPIIYGTTVEFLRYFGLEDLNDLPPIQDLEIEDDGLESMEE
ncbi:MAG: SMC-Scp complex subunit ScpB [Tissierellia bacterium]|nr:SMC-Scp complex subunit ScpB [Tissierellia bacterium]